MDDETLTPPNLGKTDPLAETQENPPAPEYVSGIRCRTRGAHEHDGTEYPPGAEITLPCELASDLIQAGAVDFIAKETTHEPE